MFSLEEVRRRMVTSGLAGLALAFLLHRQAVAANQTRLADAPQEPDLCSKFCSYECTVA